MPTEADVKREIAAYLDTLEECWHFAPMLFGYGRRGVPDRIVCYKGQFLALEVKRDGLQKASPWQLRELAGIHVAGGRAVVVWSVEQTKEIIGRIDHEISSRTL